MEEEIKNYMIPKEIKDICSKCEDNIYAQNKACAFRSLGNEYCDCVLNATRQHLKLQHKLEELEKENKELKENYKIILADRKRLEELLILSDEDYISKSKIEDKIEELESLLDLMDGDNHIAKYKKQMFKEEIDDLKELLEE